MSASQQHTHWSQGWLVAQISESRPRLLSSPHFTWREQAPKQWGRMHDSLAPPLPLGPSHTLTTLVHALSPFVTDVVGNQAFTVLIIQPFVS